MVTALQNDCSFHIHPPVKYLLPLGVYCTDVNVGFFSAERRVLPGLFLLSSVSQLRTVERYFE